MLQATARANGRKGWLAADYRRSYVASEADAEGFRKLWASD
jgi:hypothetical protein